MKLIYCPFCTDVVKLKKKLRLCECGKCFGKYEDGMTATISENAVLMGFSNNSFTEALKTNTNESFKKFESFVISKDTTTVKVKKA